MLTIFHQQNTLHLMVNPVPFPLVKKSVTSYGTPFSDLQLLAATVLPSTSDTTVSWYISSSSSLLNLKPELMSVIVTEYFMLLAFGFSGSSHEIFSFFCPLLSLPSHLVQGR